MDQAGGEASTAAAGSAITVGRPRLALVSGGLRLAQPAEPVPADWRAALARVLDWLGTPAQFVPTPRIGGLVRLAGRQGSAPCTAAAAPVFAPWRVWCPTAFQDGGAPGLPQAQFVVGYALEHARASADPRRGGVDMMLISPHPAICTGAQAHGNRVPRAGTMRAMIRAAVAEGRCRIAILVPIRHRAAVRALRLAEDPRLCPSGVNLEISTLEEALPALLGGAGRWDAIIAMPDLRAMVFATLAETTGARGPWPMLWYTRGGLVRITAEALCRDEGEGAGYLPLEPTVLAHALTLALREAGLGRAALQLHHGWTRLRASGVTTPGRGDAAPYVTAVPETEFIALLCRDDSLGPQPDRPWRALAHQHASVFSGNRPTILRIVSANLASS